MKKVKKTGKFLLCLKDPSDMFLLVGPDSYKPGVLYEIFDDGDLAYPFYILDGNGRSVYVLFTYEKREPRLNEYSKGFLISEYFRIVEGVEALGYILRYSGEDEDET